ncbi:MAG: OsmC family protein [Polyangiaceae bacterium]
MSGPEHRFACRLRWTGAAEGPTRDYRGYSRAYRVDFEGKPPLEGSAAPPFRGEGHKHNPEDLLVAALSACHCLSYLALAARHGLEVVDYEDAAEGRMEVVDGGLQFVEVVLRPRVTIAAASDADKATRLHSKAHEECFIARSVAFEVRNEPVIERLGEG